LAQDATHAPFAYTIIEHLTFPRSNYSDRDHGVRFHRFDEQRFRDDFYDA